MRNTIAALAAVATLAIPASATATAPTPIAVHNNTALAYAGQLERAVQRQIPPVRFVKHSQLQIVITYRYYNTRYPGVSCFKTRNGAVAVMNVAPSRWRTALRLETAVQKLLHANRFCA